MPPFRNSYWVEPGRLLAGACPGLASDMMEANLSCLVEAGLTLIVNLMEISETEMFAPFFPYYETIVLDLAKASGRSVRVERFPVADRGIPTPEQMTSILATIRNELENEGLVYVHCLGGIGRTGTVVGCYLKDQGHGNPLEELKSLTELEKDYFWPTPQTERQRLFVHSWKETFERPS